MERRKLRYLRSKQKGRPTNPTPPRMGRGIELASILRILSRAIFRLSIFGVSWILGPTDRILNSCQQQNNEHRFQRTNQAPWLMRQIYCLPAEMSNAHNPSQHPKNDHPPSISAHIARIRSCRYLIRCALNNIDRKLSNFRRKFAEFCSNLL